jgi:hypothetical protein
MQTMEASCSYERFVITQCENPDDHIRTNGFINDPFPYRLFHINYSNGSLDIAIKQELNIDTMLRKYRSKIFILL